MARGGARPGAGRKTGSPNKATQERQKEIAESGLTPVQFLTQVYRNEGLDMTLRVNAAKSVAPYIHPSLSSVDMALTGHVQLGGVRPDDVEGACPPS
jgi:hypothetical protein